MIADSNHSGLIRVFPGSVRKRSELRKSQSPEAEK